MRSRRIPPRRRACSKPDPRRRPARGARTHASDAAAWDDAVLSDHGGGPPGANPVKPATDLAFRNSELVANSDASASNGQWLPIGRHSTEGYVLRRPYIVSKAFKAAAAGRCTSSILKPSTT